MQLRFNRYIFGIILGVLCVIDWAVISVVLNLGADVVYAMGVMAALMLVAVVILILMIKPPAVASLHGDTLRVGRKTAHVGDVLRQSLQGNALTFAVRARDSDGFWAGSMGERDLTMPFRRIDGGRKAAEQFAAFVEVTRQTTPQLVQEARPVPAPRQREASPVAPVRAPAPTPAARAGFGRKGL